MSREYTAKDYTLSYEVLDEGVRILEYHGRETVLHIPDTIEDMPVTVIGKKAFLGQKRLREIYLPRTVHTLEEWAFAYCDFLKNFYLYPNFITLLKGVFLGCVRLSKMVLLELAEEKAAYAGELAGLLASTVTVLDATYLFEPQQVGNREWMEKYDARVLALLLQDNMEGYAQTILCGEEDYGNDNMELFRMEKRMGKVRMLFARLLNDYGLTKEGRKICVEYLVSHMPPAKHQETWKVVLLEHSDELPYYELMSRIGCITAENIEILLTDLGARQPEMKAFLLRYQQENFRKPDFFDAFAL